MKVSKLQQIVARTEKELSPNLDKFVAETQGRSPLELNTEPLRSARSRNLLETIRAPSPREFERHIGKNDLVDQNFFERGLLAAKAVCRIVMRSASGRQIGYASGFLVTPRLILTNHHVFSSPDDAEFAAAQFGYSLNINGAEQRGAYFKFRPDLYFHAFAGLDMALVAIDQTSEDTSSEAKISDYGALRLDPKVGKIMRGEFITIIQHPSGLPKQFAIRENKLINMAENFLVYKSDTAQGSSGSPLFNDTWQVVGLHSAGVPDKNNQGQWLTKDGDVATDDTDDGDINWIGNRGSRASRIVSHVSDLGANEYLEEFISHCQGEISFPPLDGGTRPIEEVDHRISGPISGFRITPKPSGTQIDLPIGYAAEIETTTYVSSEPGSQVNINPDSHSPSTVEAYKAPFVETPYGNRRGFDEDFLNEIVPFPTFAENAPVAETKSGKTEIKYEHFSLAMHAERRLAMVTACNIDTGKRKPEPGKNYTRKGLGEMRDFDIEMWVSDPRLDDEFQLPDRFFKNDRKSFDKGHIVRRDDITWGRTYRQVKRANGDSFHVTNCSPQVASFNRSNRRGEWGKLENTILKNAVDEKLVVFAGPVFSDQDREFKGEDSDGSELIVKIPSAFWKIIVANGEDGLESHGFVLEQNFENVEWEFSMPSEWKTKRTPIAEIQRRIAPVILPEIVLNADQAETETVLPC